jgi:hypothetical protein
MTAPTPTRCAHAHSRIVVILRGDVASYEVTWLRTPLRLNFKKFRRWLHRPAWHTT